MKKILRSVLFTPAELRKSFDKCISGSSDCIIFDLEDSVHPDRKSLARSTILDYFSSKTTKTYDSRKQKTIVVRINCPWTTPWGRSDIDMIQELLLKTNSSSRNIDALVLPKVGDLENINSLTSLFVEKNIQLPIWAMIETAKGVMNVDDIASSNHVETLVFGLNDLTKDLKSKHVANRQPLLYSMSKVILAARAYQKYVIDGVHLDVNDSEGLKDTCIQGRDLGFDGKSLIHPNQIEITNKCFSPSQEDIDHAKRVVNAYDDAVIHGKSMCVVDGKLVEKLHVDQAREILQMDSQLN